MFDFALSFIKGIDKHKNVVEMEIVNLVERNKALFAQETNIFSVIVL